MSKPKIRRRVDVDIKYNIMTTIPAFHVSGKSQAEGTGKVFIDTRKDAVSSGIFEFSVFAQFNPAVNDYPTGTLKLKIDLSDSAKGVFTSTSIELINSFGKHNPTIFLTGRGKMKMNLKKPLEGLRFWLMIADNGNKKTPTIAGFAIHDRNGDRVAYGTGPFVAGNVKVDPN